MLLSVKESRKQANLTQQALAEKLGVTREHISAIENGRKEPSLTLLKKIANKLDVSLVSLFQESV